MRNRYVVANWKLNLPPEGVAVFMIALAAQSDRGPTMVVAPPFPFLISVGEKGSGRVSLGAQNCSDQERGAYTGEVSASMVRACGAQYVILGHSERRSLYGETDAVIARKLSVAIAAGLTPILCIGEDLRTREAGRVATALAGQIRAVASPALDNASQILIAYEPVWAIGTGRNATGAMVAETLGQIREALKRFWPERYADTSILYGGSVTPENVGDLVANGDVDGFLVGGASLESGRFLAIRTALTPP